MSLGPLGKSVAGSWLCGMWMNRVAYCYLMILLTICLYMFVEFSADWYGPALTVMSPTSWCICFVEPWFASATRSRSRSQDGKSCVWRLYSIWMKDGPQNTEENCECIHIHQHQWRSLLFSGDWFCFIHAWQLDQFSELEWQLLTSSAEHSKRLSGTTSRMVVVAGVIFMVFLCLLTFVVCFLIVLFLVSFSIVLSLWLLSQWWWLNPIISVLTSAEVHEVLPNFHKRYCFTLWCAVPQWSNLELYIYI